MEIMEKLLIRKQLMIEYLRLKLEEQDWHGVCDAANDLRELEVEIKCHKDEECNYLSIIEDNVKR